MTLVLHNCFVLILFCVGSRGLFGQKLIRVLDFVWSEVDPDPDVLCSDHVLCCDRNCVWFCVKPLNQFQSFGESLEEKLLRCQLMLLMLNP